MKKLLSAVTVFVLLALLIPTTRAQASGPLDEIKNYTITVDPRQDGTLDMTYHFDWLVLDSSSEGPLTWVKIGIANSQVDEIKALTGNIEKIGYLSDSGSWLRIDLDRAYTAGETVSFDFSFHQSYMYRLDGEKNTCSFTFVPGWFDEITIDSLKVLWNEDGVIYSNSTGTENGYLKWEMSLDPGKRCTAIIRYSGSTFSTTSTMQAYEEETSYASGGSDDAGGIIVIFVIIFIVIIIIAAAGGGGYRGGFGGRGGGVFISHGGGHSCACASSCACACACACAGGGRAGCSAKNFYGPCVETKILSHKLQRNGE